MRRWGITLAVMAGLAAAYTLLDERDVRRAISDLKERVESGSDGTFVLFPESPSGERRGGEVGLHAPLDVPVPRPGESFVVELAEAPALQYERGDKTEEDVYYAKLARRIGGIRYDPGLGQAARELAHFHASQGVLPPTEALSFLLDSGGAAAWGVEQLILVTSDESEEALLGQLRKVKERRRADDPVLRVGLGETWTLSKPARRHIAALISRSHLELDRINREVEAGQSVTVSGRVVNHRDVTILVMGPDLEVREASVSTRGDRFESVIPVGEEAGPAYVEILARGPFGPKPLAQLCLSVDEELPWDLATQWPPDESALQSSSQAEAYALELINADRTRFGLAPVVRDPLLDDAAIIHSDDMATGGFFGHHSPNTGSVGDRIASVGARTVFHGENIARNDSIFDAQIGLMHSIGHRRNILNPEATHVGLGARAVNRSNNRQWLLTQVFAKPAPVVDPEVAREDVISALGRARQESGVRQLRLDPLLDRVAQAQAEGSDSTARGALNEAKRGLKRGGWAWVATMSELQGLELPEDVLERKWRRLGVGVAQDTDREGPDITVVLIVGG